MADSLALSLLDLIPVHTGQTTGDAIAASLELARVADESGLTRYWVAEHHNTDSVASTTPPVLIGLLASATSRIRVGSGGVMLPNHAPLAVAEQFAVLEAAFPGRIDLGIGRAPGTDPVTSWALRSGGAVGAEGADPVSRFPEFVEQVIAFMSPDGAGVRIGGRQFEISATPKAVGEPPVWLLGSSDYSARLAARLGLPYVFAHHFAGRGTTEALALYRDQFTGPDQPRTFVTVNAVVAESEEEARRLARPFQHMMASIYTGAPRQPLYTVEESLAATSPLPPDKFENLTRPWFLGTADSVAEQIRSIAAEFDVDEVMVQPIAGSYENDPLGRTPAREATVRELAARLIG
ncbi:MAG: LLM class flavin-dependent oxidoreductase [Dermatophilus congolensis]|nr:LLM class flavin-dependent oxidoreductase [Dermatophilus congolensis]